MYGFKTEILTIKSFHFTEEFLILKIVDSKSWIISLWVKFLGRINWRQLIGCD